MPQHGPTDPVCEGSKVMVELAFGETDTWGSRARCSECGHVFRVNRNGRLRKHRRLSS